jgi:hypothetical protein
LTGNDKVTLMEEAMSGSGPVRKYAMRMPGFSPRVFFFSSSNMATEVHLSVRNRKLRNTRSSSKQCWLGCYIYQGYWN